MPTLSLGDLWWKRYCAQSLPIHGFHFWIKQNTSLYLILQFTSDTAIRDTMIGSMARSAARSPWLSQKFLMFGENFAQYQEEKSLSPLGLGCLVYIFAWCQPKAMKYDENIWIHCEAHENDVRVMRWCRKSMEKSMCLGNSHQLPIADPSKAVTCIFWQNRAKN